SAAARLGWFQGPGMNRNPAVRSAKAGKDSGLFEIVAWCLLYGDDLIQQAESGLHVLGVPQAVELQRQLRFQPQDMPATDCAVGTLVGVVRLIRNPG
ncbi:MAG: hypothetical protein N3G20_08870, partial [Verrucomicrobiae bacterium]|nr:hypothetical protein [Verrucomicrobiae bacterium]